jgi:hypothetical protein
MIVSLSVAVAVIMSFGLDVILSLGLDVNLNVGLRLDLDLFLYLDVSMNPDPDQNLSSVVPASLIVRVIMDVRVSIDVIWVSVWVLISIYSCISTFL